MRGIRSSLHLKSSEMHVKAPPGLEYVRKTTGLSRIGEPSYRNFEGRASMVFEMLTACGMIRRSKCRSLPSFTGNLLVSRDASRSVPAVVDRTYLLRTIAPFSTNRGRDVSCRRRIELLKLAITEIIFCSQSTRILHLLEI